MRTKRYEVERKSTFQDLEELIARLNINPRGLDIACYGSHCPTNASRGGNFDSPLGTLGTIDELVEFFETHDLGEYWDQLPEAHFDVDIRRRTHIFAIEEDLANRLTEIAQSKQIPSETLVNLGLREKIEQAGS